MTINLKSFGVILILFLSGPFAEEITINGFVHDYNSAPVENAIVTLL